ncbi:MAG: ComF family protein [bacterium]|jgi:ComF family protein|nr:ComF family protein [bacterium]
MKRLAGMAFVWNLLSAWLDLIYPPVCAGCGALLQDGEAEICAACRDGFLRLPPPYCPRCGAPVAEAHTYKPSCRECPEGPLYFNQAHALFSYYDPKLRRCIHDLKFHYHTALAEVLGGMLADTYGKVVLQKKIDAIVPVPLHKKRLRDREFNQSTLLASPLARVADIPIVETVVHRIKKTRPQSQLNRDARKSNPVGAFAPVQAGCVQNQSLLVVDDIFTTGTTVNQVCAALRQGGAAYIMVLTLARAVELPQPGDS